MDLESIIIAEIRESDHEQKAQKEVARRQKEEKEVARRQKEEKEIAAFKIKQKEENIQFDINKKIFEESFVREIMATIIKGINSPMNKKFLPLRERIFEIIRCNQHNNIKDNSIFFLQMPYSFANSDNYTIKLSYDNDSYLPIFTFTVYDQKINFCCSLLEYTTTVNLSYNKEEAAVQIIRLLMID